MNKKVIILTAFTVIIAIIIFFLNPVSPGKIKITNITNNAATISWVTSKPVKGAVLLSKEKWRLGIPLLNNFFSKKLKDFIPNQSDVHYVVLEGLTAETTYYYLIKGSHTVMPFKTTTPKEKISQPLPAYGTVIERDGKTPAANVILYVNDSYSAITNNSGNWTLDLSPLSDKKKLKVDIEGGNKGTLQTELELNRIQPAATFKLK